MIWDRVTSVEGTVHAEAVEWLREAECISDEAYDWEEVDPVEGGPVVSPLETAVIEAVQPWNEDILPLRNLASRRASKAFFNHWAASLRNQFPLRSNRPSDRAAMAKWLVGEMRTRGYRTTHIANIVPVVVSLALLPIRADMIAEAVLRHLTPVPRWRRWLDVLLGGEVPGQPDANAEATQFLDDLYPGRNQPPPGAIPALA